MTRNPPRRPALALARSLTFIVLVASATLLSAGVARADPPAVAAAPPAVQRSVWRSTPQGDLEMVVFSPADLKPGERRPAVVFFCGGGWNTGALNQFFGYAKHLAGRGMVVACPEYRVKEKHGTTPFDAVRDAFAAVRYVRANADRLGVDPHRLAAGGGSAGAQLAAATATLTADWTTGPADAPDADPNASVDARPDALVLFSPVYDNGPGGYGADRVGDRYPEFSPLHNLHANMPPTFVAVGSDDAFVPVETAREWQRRQQDLGVRSDLEVFDGAPHPFFNEAYAGGKDFPRCVRLVDAFLVSLGWLPPAP